MGFIDQERDPEFLQITDPEERKEFVYLLARFVKSFHFLNCFFTFPLEIKQLATFAEYVGPQLIKAGSVSELMKQIRQTELTVVTAESIRQRA